MQQGFPPEPPWLSPLICSSATLAVLIAIGGIAIQSRRRTTVLTTALWTFFGFAVIAASWLTIRTVELRHGAGLTGVEVILVRTAIATSGIGFLQSLVRLPPQSRRTPGFRWLCGVILLMGMWILIYPAIPAPRSAVDRTKCRTNLKQLGRALDNYYHAMNGLFPPTAGDLPEVSWRVALLPLLDNPPPLKYVRDEPWNSAANSRLARERIPNYVCPAVDRPRDDEGRYFTAYVAPTGSDTILQPDRSRTRQEIPRDTSNTILLVEACGLEIVWTEPRDFDIDHQPIGVNLKGKGHTDSPGLLSSYHPGGQQLLMADGSIRIISPDTDPTILRAMLSAEGVKQGNSRP